MPLALQIPFVNTVGVFWYRIPHFFFSLSNPIQLPIIPTPTRELNTVRKPTSQLPDQLVETLNVLTKPWILVETFTVPIVNHSS